MSRLPLFAAALFGVALLTGCPDPQPAFPADFREQYREVYPCEGSAEHALTFVRAWANAEAAPVYGSAPGEPFAGPAPAGAIVVKEEYANPGCTDLMGYTVMRKEDDGSWFFQTVDAERQITDEGRPARCVSCHQSCGRDTDSLCAFPRES